MMATAIAPQSELSSLVESIFIGVFTITGIILILPYRKITEYIRGKVLACLLTIFSGFSLVFHSLVLIESGLPLTSILTILFVFYPLICVNIYWYFKNAKL